MKLILFFLIGITIIYLAGFFMRVGIMVVYKLLSVWYITLPLLALIIILINKPRKKASKADRVDLDPSKEVKLDKEPEIRDLNSQDQKDDK